MANTDTVIAAMQNLVTDSITTNGTGAITGQVHRETLLGIVALLGSLLSEPDDVLLAQFPAWDVAENYLPSDQKVVKHAGKIWAFVGAVANTGTTPGTNASVWAPISSLSLAHLRNDDDHLDFYGTNKVSAADIRSFIDDFDAGNIPANTDGLLEGVNNLYSTPSRTRAVLLTGLSTAISTPVNAGMTLIAAIGRLQGQISLINVPANTGALLEGTTNLYHTAARVLATVLAGYASGANTALAATDTILQAFAKIQGQISALAAASGITEAQAKDTVRTYTKAQRMAWVALTHAATVTPDANAGNNFTVTIADSFTLANFTNLATAAGQSGTIEMIMGGAGSYTVAFGAAYVSDEASADMQPSTAVAAITHYGYMVNSEGTKISLYKRGPLNQITI